MREDFLHYVWQYGQFDRSELQTTEGEPVAILKTGFLNTNAGPDFLDARVRIGEMEWSGHVEIHIDSKDWYRHRHHEDKAYDNVVLHVVWEDAAPAMRSDSTAIPTVVLRHRVADELCHRYQSLIGGMGMIPCEHQLQEVEKVRILSMFDRALVHRLERKAGEAAQLAADNQDDWEETAYQLMGQNFGFKLNADAFLTLCRSLPLKVLQKHRDNLVQVEALLFGQAGLLEKERYRDDYFRKLQQEYAFLRHKYGLDTPLKPVAWKFMRSRPANFPTIRLAQFARLIHKETNFFSFLTGSNRLGDIRGLLQIHQSDYWQYHYRFGKVSGDRIPGLGRSSADNLIINTVCPLLVAYGKRKGDQEPLDRAMRFLEMLHPENNKITRYWDRQGIDMANAFYTQAGIELFNNFCTPNKCLHCTIGVSLMKEEKAGRSAHL